MFSNECHLFLVMIFHILQERPYALCSKLRKVKKVAEDRQLREFRKLHKNLITFFGSHIELGRLFSVVALRRASVAN